MLQLRQALAKDPKIDLNIKLISEIGNEAFAEVRRSGTTITARQQDLIFAVYVDADSRNTFGDATVLARQAASRWREGVGMIEREEPIVQNESVAVPVDTRLPAVAAAQDWPDACALLTRADVMQTFPGAAIKDPRRIMGQITHDRRENRIERLPNPIACQYDVRRKVERDGKSFSLNHLAQISLKNVAATLPLSRAFYETSRKVVGPLTPLDGLGDEAGIDQLNRITIRKGRFTIEVKVTGGERNGMLQAEARERAIELAETAAGRLP